MIPCRPSQTRSNRYPTIILLLAGLLLFLSGCSDEEIPPRITYFGLTDFQSTLFTVDTSGIPAEITNPTPLPFWMKDSMVTIDFRLTQFGSLVLDGNPLIGKKSRLPVEDTILLSVLDQNGLETGKYKLFIQVIQDNNPKLLEHQVVLNPSGNNPLSARLDIRLDRDCRITARIHGENEDDLYLVMSDLIDEAQLPILGLYPDKSNQITLFLSDINGLTGIFSISIVTPPLPDFVTEPSVSVNEPHLMEEGFIHARIDHFDDTGLKQSFAAMIDPYGKIRWLYTGQDMLFIEPLRNGHWMLGQHDQLIELDRLMVPTGFECTAHGLMTAFSELPDGNIIVITDPDPGDHPKLIEISRLTADVVREWDLSMILDARREPFPSEDHADWLHATAIEYNGLDQSITISARNQSLLIKIGYPDAYIQWILGHNARWTDGHDLFLLHPAGDDLEWPWGQHGFMSHPADPNKILVFDNGLYRSLTEPLALEDCYSQAVEYEIDPSRREIRQIWSYGKARGNTLFSYHLGNATYLPQTGNRLICFGGMIRDLNGLPVPLIDPETGLPSEIKSSATILEVDQNGNVVFEAQFRSDLNDLSGYQCHRIQKLQLFGR